MSVNDLSPDAPTEITHDARIHLREIFYEDRSKRYVILKEKNARPPRGRKRVRLSCVSDATSPIPHHKDTRASNART
ncbi:hypothetical protein Y032_0014g2498 [Ancylostoma ceylanicum]|uniref:Uncharacterized protein n=1 Tax=Ancylostoma ceylanicum TaxID=53326 RepID=A0A016VBK6_9BILA|nr:hypothetical protein Y032_0014g2498 [Ancylostoma ceylanicum]